LKELIVLFPQNELIHAYMDWWFEKGFFWCPCGKSSLSSIWFFQL